MTCKMQWILWVLIMCLFLGLTLSEHFDSLAVAIVATALIWYAVVPRATSR